MSNQPPKPPEVPEITTQEAWEEARQQRAIIVDVREDEELAEISVPGAIHIPLGQLPARLTSIPRGKPVYFLCRSGNRSSYATELYRQRVGPDAANIRGGILDWYERGLPSSLNPATDDDTREP